MTHNASATLFAEKNLPRLKSVISTVEYDRKQNAKLTDLNPRSGSRRIMSLTSYQAAPPRVFEEERNA
jgi:hypothetical protein